MVLASVDNNMTRAEILTEAARLDRLTAGRQDCGAAPDLRSRACWGGQCADCGGGLAPSMSSSHNMFAASMVVTRAAAR